MVNFGSDLIGDSTSSIISSVGILLKASTILTFGFEGHFNSCDKNNRKGRSYHTNME